MGLKLNITFILCMICYEIIVFNIGMTINRVWAEYSIVCILISIPIFVDNYASPCPYPLLWIFTLPVLNNCADAHWG